MLGILAQEKGVSRLFNNAFHVLGLAASVDDLLINAAANKMRQAIRRGSKVQSAYDLLWFPAVSRTEKDIDNALLQLSRPTTRILHRLFWFMGDIGWINNVDPLKLEYIARSLAKTQDPIILHDNALFTLLAALYSDKAMMDESIWRLVYARWREVCSCDRLWAMLWDFEEQWSYHKASEADLLFIKNNLISLVNEELAYLAKKSVDEHKDYLYKRIVAILSYVKTSKKGIAAFEELVLSEVENSFTANCMYMNELCRNIIRQDSQAKYNSDICDNCLSKLRDEIEPSLERLLNLVDSAGPVCKRIKKQAVKCFCNLAMAHTWANQFELAEILLEQALQYSANITDMMKVENHLAVILQQNIFSYCAQVKSGLSGLEYAARNNVIVRRRICQGLGNTLINNVSLRLSRLCELHGSEKLLVKANAEAASCYLLLGKEFIYLQEWHKANTMLQQALAIAGTDNKLCYELDTLISKVRLELRQAAMWKNGQYAVGPPKIKTICGCGLNFVGRRNFDTVTNHYITTYYLVIFGIPLIPIRCYQIGYDEQNESKVVSEEPLSIRETLQSSIVMIGFTMLLMILPLIL